MMKQLPFPPENVRLNRLQRSAGASLLVLFFMAGPLSAQNDVARAPNDNPLGTISRGLKMQAPAHTPPDWVVKTRKPEQETKFLPTGAAARTEPATPLSQDKLRDLERSLDAERSRHDKLSGRNAAPNAKKSVAMGPLPKKTAAKRPCVLTCASPIGSQKKR